MRKLSATVVFCLRGVRPRCFVCMEHSAVDLGSTSNWGPHALSSGPLVAPSTLFGSSPPPPHTHTLSCYMVNPLPPLVDLWPPLPSQTL